jgi:hypothetical protein
MMLLVPASVMVGDALTSVLSKKNFQTDEAQQKYVAVADRRNKAWNGAANIE